VNSSAAAAAMGADTGLNQVSGEILESWRFSDGWTRIHLETGGSMDLF
jgi:hypothetical protein